MHIIIGKEYIVVPPLTDFHTSEIANVADRGRGVGDSAKITITLPLCMFRRKTTYLYRTTKVMFTIILKVE